MLYNEAEDVWIVSIPASQSENGKRQRERFTDGMKAAARQAEIDREKNAQAQIVLATKDAMGWPALLITAWTMRWQHQSDGARTQQRAKYVTDYLETCGASITSYTYSQLEAFSIQVVASGQSNQSAQRCLAAFSGMVREVRKRQEIIDVSSATIPRVARKTIGRIFWYSRKDCDEIFRAMTLLQDGSDLRKQALRYFELLLETGCRPSEPLSLATRDVRLSSRTIIVWDDVSKTSGHRSIPLTNRAVVLIQEQLDDMGTTQTNSACKVGQALFPALQKHNVDWFWRQVKKDMGRAQDQTLIPYGFRHTCACRLVQSDVHLLAIKEWLGHKVVDTTLNYAKLFPKDLIKAADKVIESWE